MFENNKTKKQGVHYTRYIISWINEGGEIFDQFKDWLKSEGCTEDEIRDIYELGTCGKMELEVSAKKFMTQNKNKGCS